MDITQTIPDAKWNNRILPALKTGLGTDDEQVVVDYLKEQLRERIKSMVLAQETNKAVADANITEIDV